MMAWYVIPQYFFVIVIQLLTSYLLVMGRSFLLHCIRMGNQKHPRPSMQYLSWLMSYVRSPKKTIYPVGGEGKLTKMWIQVESSVYQKINDQKIE